MDRPTLYLECNQCGMKFEKLEQVNVHKNRFCAGSDYADYNKLQRILNHATKERQETPLNLDKAIRNTSPFLATVNKKQGNSAMNLAVINQEIISKQQEFNSKAKKISDREDLLRDEMDRINKNVKGDESELMQIMSDIEEKKTAEVRATKEKELVSRALKDLDRRNLNTLEYQKKMQMKALDEERKNLKKKENEVFQELQRMQARLLDDEVAIKAEKDKINMNIVTIKDINQDLAEKRLEELSNIRGKEVAAIKEKKELLEMEKGRNESEMRQVQKGDLLRKNTTGIQAGSSILGPIVPLDLEDRRNLPEEVVRQNHKWKEDYDRLNTMKKNYHDFVKNDPGYDVKPGPGDFKPRFAEEMNNMLGFYDGDLKPTQKARLLEYIKEDLESKDPSGPRPQKPQAKIEESAINSQVKYNSAKFKLSTEPHQLYNKKGIEQPEDLYSPQVFSKYQQEFRNNYSMVNPGTNIPKPRSTGRIVQKIQATPRPLDEIFERSGKNKLKTHTPDMKSANRQNPYQPYIPYFPYYREPFSQAVPAAVNPTTEKLKIQLQKLEEKLKAKNTKRHNPRALEEALNSEGGAFGGLSVLPEEKVIENLLNQERQELKLLSALPPDSDLYQAKLNHFKEMSQVRARMESTLQDLVLQRLRRNMNHEEVFRDKRLVEEMWQEGQRKLQVISKITPKPEEPPADYYPAKGLFMAWDLLTGIPQRYRKTQIAYGVYERGETRMDPRLVVPAANEEDSNNPLALKCVFKDIHDIKKLPPQEEIIAVLEVQGINTYGKVSNNGWTVIEIFTGMKKVKEGYWRLPVYSPPTLTNIQLQDLAMQVLVPNAFVYLRIFAADNASKFPVLAEMGNYRIPSIHFREVFVEANNSELLNRSGLLLGESRVLNQPDPIRAPSKAGSLRKVPANTSGICVRLESIQGFQPRSPLKFRISIYYGAALAVDDRGSSCKWLSDTLAVQKADTSIQDIYHPSLDGSRLNTLESPSPDSTIPINKQSQFLKDFIRYQEQSNWSEDLVMLIEVLERTSRKPTTLEGGPSSAVDDFFVVAWTLFGLTDSSEKLMNFGTIEANLYKPPVPEPLHDLEDIRQHPASLRLTIQDIGASMASGLHRLRPTSALESFLENLKPQHEDGKPFLKGDGIDIYVDAARFLPDNTSCTKIVVKAFTWALESIGQAVGGLPDLNSPAFSPVYGFRTEFRMPVFDPTTTLVISIITLDTAHNETRLLGYSAINLFLHRYSRKQPTETSEQEFVLNAGAFQLPIYCQEPLRRVPFSLQTFTAMELIPCATLLVRIREAPKAQQGVKVLSINNVPRSELYIRGVIVAPPKYEQRAYNTSYCMPTPVERTIYAERAKRQSPTVKNATVKMMEALGNPADLSDDQMLDWIDDILNTDPRTPMIDMKLFAKYSPRLGFKICIDAVHHMPKNSPHVVLFSLNPPGGFYSQSASSQDIQICDKYDWNSSLETPAFLDGFHTYKNIQFTPYLHIIIDLRAVNMEDKVLVPVAWTVLPVFYEDGYVKSGIFQLPFFAGAVPANLLPEIASNPPWEFILKSATKSGGPQFLEPISVILRIVDSQREGHFSMPMDLNRIDYSYIPPKLLSRFSYNAAARQRNQDGVNLRKMIPKDISAANFEKVVHNIVVNDLDLPHL